MVATGLLELAPDSIASLGELDANSLSDLWTVFTKCKDSLQNGRRLENLSWRLWFDSGRRETQMYAEKSSSLRADTQRPNWAEGTPAQKAQEAGWSDPEWSEATDSESEGEESEGDNAAERGSSRPRPTLRRSSTERTKINPATPPTAITTTNLNDPHPPSRPSLSARRPSGGAPKGTITGGSLQRMITGLTTLPAITPAPKARSAVDVSPPSELPVPSITNRGCSAPATATLPTIPAVATPVATTSPLPPSPAPKATSPHLPSSSSTHSPQPMVRSSSSSAGAAILAKSLSLKRTASKSGNASPRPESRARLSNGGTSHAHGPAPAPVPAPVQARKSEAPMIQRTLGSTVQLQRTASAASFEPKSLVKGFDTTAFENRPQQGSIAPPPTPAPAPPATLAPSPPSALKSAFKKPGASKKIFFISSPNSDSEDDMSSSQSAERKAGTSRHVHTQGRVPAPPSPSPASQPTAAAASTSQQNADEDDEWDDEDSEEEDDDDDDASSGWGSEYSTESDSPRAGKSTKNQALFAKRPTSSQGEGPLKPRGPGLLSQLFHPDLLLDETDRRHSTVDMSRHKSLPALHTSKSAGVLTEQLRNKSFLRGAPAGTEMESSSEEEDSSDEYEDEDEEEESPPLNTVAQALARHQRRIEAAGPIAPPQTPRTTRRAMLATELSESLRRNLLWERQTRNRVMGGPPNRFQAQAQPTPAQKQQEQRPASAIGTTTNTTLVPPPQAGTQPAFEGLRAPHPSPATRNSSPVHGNMVRRHTTGHGLYLAAQTGALAKGRSPDSDTGSASTSRQDAYGGAFVAYHDHGW